MDVTEQSTHLARSDRRMGDDWLEDWLNDWGIAQNIPIKELASPTKTSLKVAEELRPEKLQEKIPEYRDDKGRVLPLHVRRLIYDLMNIWKKKTAENRCQAVSPVPAYWIHRRISRLNRVIGQLSPMYREVIKWRYEDDLSHSKVLKLKGMKKDMYYRRLVKAKENIKKLLKTCE